MSDCDIRLQWVICCVHYKVVYLLSVSLQRIPFARSTVVSIEKQSAYIFFYDRIIIMLIQLISIMNELKLCNRVLFFRMLLTVWAYEGRMAKRLRSETTKKCKKYTVLQNKLELL